MANDHSGKFTLPILGGILAAIAVAAPCFFSRTESLHDAMAGRGEVSGWMERLAAAGYAAAELPGVDAARAACVAAPVLVAFFAVSWIARKLPLVFQNRIRWGLIIAAIGLIGLGSFKALQAWRRDIREIHLLAPVDLLKAVGGGRVFLNSAALSASRLLAPDLVLRSPDSASLQQLTVSPVRWREEDRQAPFDAILLAVPLEDSLPLVEMLTASPQWHIARIDNQGLLYRRDTGIETQAEPVFANARDNAIYCAQKAMVLHFLGKNKDARELMRQARAAAPRDPFVLVRSATLAAAFKQWPTTRKDAEAALAVDSSSLQARYLLALALLETGNCSSASEEAASLCFHHPNDPSVLWLTARICREANDPTAEIAALEKLLALAQKQKEEPTIIHIHLAQAWAKRGFAPQALQNYEAALKGNLTSAQRAELENTRSTILSRAPRL